MLATDRPMFECMPGFCAGQPFSAVEILLMQVGNAQMTVSVTNGSEATDKKTTQTFAPGWSGLLILDRIQFEVLSGSGIVSAIDVAAMAKLQAFLDAARFSKERERANHAVNAIAVNAVPGLIAIAADNPEDIHDARLLEDWFLRQSSNPDANFENVSLFLRLTEWYRLVRFLLRQPATHTMQALSARYGLSYSHFRRLCHEAFGRGGKAELQQWRNVRALLDMADCMSDRSGNLTDVALRHGFASSSHFSDAMKGQFGMSPRHLTRTLNTENND